MEQPGEGCETRWRPADDGEHQREPVVRCAHDRLRASAHADPGRKWSELRVRHDILVGERGARVARPGDRAALAQLGEQVDLLFEQLLVVGEVVPEEGERVDARTSSEDDLGPTVGDGVESGEALKHPDRIIRAQHGDCRADVDSARARRDRGQHHVGSRHRPVVGVVLADPEEVHAHLLGENTLLDHVPERLGVGERAVLGVVGDIAEGVQAEDKRKRRSLNRSVHGSLNPWCS